MADKRSTIWHHEFVAIIKNDFLNLTTVDLIPEYLSIIEKNLNSMIERDMVWFCQYYRTFDNVPEYVTTIENNLNSMIERDIQIYMVLVLSVLPYNYGNTRQIN